MRIEPRSAWGPVAKLGPAMPRKPGGWIADEAWLHHTVTTCTTNGPADVRTVERIGIQRFGRMSYSWLYHWRTRTWYEGAGRTIGAHTGGRNSRSLGLVVIGNTETDNPPHLVDDTAGLIRWLIDRGDLAPPSHANVSPGSRWTGRSYPTGGHRDQKATACPGRHAYAAIGPIRARVTAGPPAPSPSKPPTSGGLTMSEAKAIRAEMKKANATQNAVIAELGKQAEARAAENRFFATTIRELADRIENLEKAD